ncbi:MAG TPA: glutamine synthetase III [Candidatus Monoglobus merdigallinarum]|uniref:Glutamine synthetase III n=1 Tax=Candidatus Monoglobus merdigallinarum TaxID=2838698 RepID=A0A9D1PRJ6_9FIRM|nr:glutamine synthetase III [Candidatus Monoglobus merdigallinarum]
MDRMNELFGSAVFEDSVQKVRLPDNIYKQLRKTKEEGTPLTREVADVVANAMKDWAVENGVTHFTHWFQPMTGVTAEKHDSFIQPDGIDNVIMEFSGKELIKGEPDASSFPSGGLRSTFEARGYTAWDPTSNAFIKDGILCIPTVFCSYTGEALDKKTPLMRSMEALSKSAVNVLRIMGDNEVTRVITTVGPEQEYFLIDRKVALKRKDITYTGRTLFGAPSPKGQELDDHYFGVVKRRVSEYMKDVDEELWKLGILAKTKHNEVAPAQHELAPIFTQANIATDHNQLTMEIMKKVAEKHGMKCLLHEKPFEGINGSGKHNNWSISTDKGDNLLKPGKTPHDNPRFLLFLSAVITAVDEHQGLLRSSVASAGNDHRLGANEAPPAIISIFLGDDIKEVLDSIEKGSYFENKSKEVMNSGIDAVPDFAKDTTDRNRTSPFAFTGNKFEFRMPGSALSISGPNFILNTAVADVLDGFAERLEKADDITAEIYEIVKDTMKEHKRIIFNGNNYSDEWVAEAEKRGLCNLKSAPEAFPEFVSEKSIALFERHGILTRDEMLSRYEINLENYSKAINIEAKTTVEMARRDIAPAVAKYVRDLADTVIAKKQIGNVCCGFEESVIPKLSELEAKLYDAVEKLDSSISEALAMPEGHDQAMFYHDVVLENMNGVREIADEMEKHTAEEYWPFPTYGDLLFSIQD